MFYAPSQKHAKPGAKLNLNVQDILLISIVYVAVLPAWTTRPASRCRGAVLELPP